MCSQDSEVYDRCKLSSPNKPLKQLSFASGPTFFFHVLMINPGLETDLHKGMQK